MFNKLIGMIKQGYKTLSHTDTNAFPKAQGSSNQNVSDYTSLSVYGICANAPVGSHVLFFSSQANESVKFGIENDFKNRKKGLKLGESCLYNTLTKSYVYLKEDGSVEIFAPEVTIKGNSSFTGNLTVEGDIKVTGNTELTGDLAVTGNTELTGDLAVTGNIEVTGGDLVVDGLSFKLHVHTGVTAGSASTGVAV